MNARPRLAARLLGSVTSIALLAFARAGHTQTAVPFPPLPDSSGWGIHVLTAARDPGGSIWLGTYGHGILRLPAGGGSWEQIQRDSTRTDGLSWD